jgi:hypothetical protein
MFPAGRNQEVLVDLLDAYESREQNSTANEKSNELVKAILELYSCSENDLLESCKSYKERCISLENERISLENKVNELENDGIRLENDGIRLENDGIRLENERISSENEDIWLKIKRNITPFSAYLLENTAPNFRTIKVTV